MLDSAPKAIFQLLARSRHPQEGSHRATACARRRASPAASSPARRSRKPSARPRRLEADGLTETFDHLGESVTRLDDADAATRDYLDIIRAIVRFGRRAQSLAQADAARPRRRPRHRGRPPAAYSGVAGPAGFFVRIDMESSRYTDVTLDIFETLWQQDHRQIGVVLQSDLYRSEKDLERVNALGARVRLVKGAYREPRSVAYQQKADVDAAYAQADEGAADERHVSGHRHARPGHDRAGPTLGGRAGRRARSVRVPDAVRHPPRPAGARSSPTAIACACTCPSAASGSPTSCDVWANGPPTSGSSCAACSVNVASRGAAGMSSGRVVAITGRIGRHRTRDRPPARPRRRVHRAVSAPDATSSRGPLQKSRRQAAMRSR